MWQHDAAAAQPAPALGRVQHPKKDLLAASAALVSYDIELQAAIRLFSAKQAWAETRRPYVDALSKCSRDCRLSETANSMHAVQCAKAAYAAFAQGSLGVRCKA